MSIVLVKKYEQVMSTRSTINADNEWTDGCSLITGVSAALYLVFCNEQMKNRYAENNRIEQPY